MSNWQWFLLGGMVAWSPALIMLALLFWRATEGNGGRA